VAQECDLIETANVSAGGDPVLVIMPECHGWFSALLHFRVLNFTK